MGSLSDEISVKLPKFELREDEISREIVYGTIKNELRADCAPSHNLASFVTTSIEQEASELLIDATNKNFVDHDAYPAALEMERRCVQIIGNLFHVPCPAGRGDVITGTSTVGSSEAVMLAVLALKQRWARRRHDHGGNNDRPNIVMSAAVQVCWKKAARYCGLEARYVDCDPHKGIMDPIKAVDLCDPNTIGICAILGTTYTGEYEDVAAINNLLNERHLDVPIHVDAASGGFVAPFMDPNLIWDFLLDHVVSINVSGHKYGLVYAGIGWVIWRSPEFLPSELVFDLDYLGAHQTSITMNFSRGSSQVVAQYYQLSRLGRTGYRRILSELARTAEELGRKLEDMGFVLYQKANGRGLPILVFHLHATRADHRFDEFDLALELRRRGWMVPAYTLPANMKQRNVLRIVVRKDFTQRVCEEFLAALGLTVQRLSG